MSDVSAIPGRRECVVRDLVQHGIVDGERRLTMSIQWYMETAHLDDPHPPLWRIHVRGQPGVTISVEMENRAGDNTPTSTEQIAVAGSVINAIPIVCAAPPVVLTRPLATPCQYATAGRTWRDDAGAMPAFRTTSWRPHGDAMDAPLCWRCPPPVRADGRYCLPSQVSN